MKPKTIEAALAKSARTVAKRLRDHPGEPRALFLHALLAQLRDDAPPQDVALDAADRASVCGVVCGMWREMVAHEALTPARAHILATQIAALSSAPAVCFVLAHEARSLGCVAAADALMRDHASFVARAATLPMDRALLDALGIDVFAARVRWHDDGHLAELAKDKRALQLDAQPGSGRYVEEGKRGGSGFAVQERYERGAARGTFYSPWHDGEEYANEQPWLAWVSACAVTVLKGSS